MPSPKPPSVVSARDFGTLKGRRNAPDLPPRARQLVDLRLHGTAERPGPMSLDAAAEVMRISVKTARQYAHHPRAQAYYLELARLDREGEYARNTAAAVEIRDDPKMKETAAGAKARIEAAKFLEGGHEQRVGGTVVNLGFAIQPGYVIAPSPRLRPHAEIIDAQD